MTKSEIELLMARDVDEISEVAFHHPKRQLSITLKNAAALIGSEKLSNGIEGRLFVFKLLRFVQAALAGLRSRPTAEVVREVFGSTQLVLKRNIGPDLNRAAHDVLSVLIVKHSLPDKQQIPLPEAISKYAENLRRRRASELERKRLVLPAKPQPARTKTASKPKGLAH